MNTVFNKIIQKSIPYMFIFLFAYILSTIAFIYLPRNGVEFVNESNSYLEYRKYDGFYSKVSKKVIEKKEQKVEQTLLNYALKAIYSTTSNSGWITIENIKNQESYILSQNEDIDGYILIKLYKNHVIMEKDKKQYRLDITQIDKKVSYDLTDTRNNTKSNVVLDGSIVKVKRNYLNTYVKDVNKIWNNIEIKEIKSNGKIDGFKVNKVVKGSVFEKLGLEKNDIIKSINNNILSSYSDAFKVYNNINNTKYLNIEILRNNEIMELNYEID